jgi:hypothetical protein
VAQVSCKMTITKMITTRTPIIVPIRPLFMNALLGSVLPARLRVSLMLRTGDSLNASNNFWVPLTFAGRHTQDLNCLKDKKA